MTNDEAIAFLRKYLEDFEHHAAFAQASFRSAPGEAGRAADRELADSLSMRRLPVTTLLRAAGVIVIPLLDPQYVGSDSMMEVRSAVLQAIGAFSHRLVRLQDEFRAPAQTVTPPTAPAVGTSLAPETRRVTADDLPEMPLGQLLKTLKVRHGVALVGGVLTVLGAGATGGYVVGSTWAWALAAKNQELAVEKVTNERDACRKEVAALEAPAPLPKAKPEQEPAKPAAWSK